MCVSGNPTDRRKSRRPKTGFFDELLAYFSSFCRQKSKIKKFWPTYQPTHPHFQKYVIIQETLFFILRLTLHAAEIKYNIQNRF